MLLRDGVTWLTDPGAPKYTRQTFSAGRYEILYCRSRGHSVPLINDQEQPEGGQYQGTLKVQPPDEKGVKTAEIDMSRAYAVRSLKSLVRRLALYPDGHLILEDHYVFSTKPKSLLETFITFESAKVEQGGNVVTLRHGRRRFRIQAIDTLGRFRVESCEADLKDSRDGQVIHRLVFKPKTLKKNMTLKFQMGSSRNS